jgi:hypothetical protein
MTRYNIALIALSFFVGIVFSIAFAIDTNAYANNSGTFTLTQRVNMIEKTLGTIQTDINTMFEINDAQLHNIAQIRCAFRVYEDGSAIIERNDNTRANCYARIMRGN